MKSKIQSFLNNRSVEKFLIFLIILNLLVFVLNTDVVFRQKYIHITIYFELASIIIFSIEYILRVISLKNIKQLFEPMMVVDFLAIAPCFLSFLNLNTLFLRALRLARLMRIFKIGRYTKAFDRIKECLLQKKEELVVAFMILFCGVLISSILIYFAENAANPKQFPSVIASFWWSVVTFTSVGYGDVCPITPLGKVVGSLTAIMGAGLHGLLVAILGAAFMEMLEKNKQTKNLNPKKEPTVEPTVGIF